MSDSATQHRGAGYLDGLNGLRFIAATFVLVSHAHETVVKLGLAQDTAAPLAAFNRGRAAVDFFFTLSGFLITYLLIVEARRTGTVSLPRFYIRRASRIWPLYFLVLAIGFGLFAFVYPRVLHQTYFHFNLAEGLLLYIVFLPNLMASLYKVGMLNPLWSIGVEEQFYLCWAPLVKLAHRRLPRLIAVSIVGTVACHALLDGGYLTADPRLTTFLQTLRFQYMAVGAMFAWVLCHRLDAYRRSWLASQPAQWLVILVLGYHYLFGSPATYLPWEFDVPLAILYGLLILNVSAVPVRAIELEREPLVYLGKISYGIYMFHMTADYLLRMAVERFRFSPGPLIPVTLLYSAVLLAVTVGVASVSFRYFEARFTAPRVRAQHPAPAPHDAQPDPALVLQPSLPPRPSA